MKLVYKIITLTLLISTVSARSMIILSGRASLEQQNTISEVLQQTINIPKRLILFDFENKKCVVNRKALIQMCFNGLSFKVSSQRKEILQKTFKRIIKMSNNPVTQHTEGASIEK